jgi:hypothetical protein
MNKKLMLMGAGFTLGSTLLVTSAFAGIGDAPGYEAYKSAVKTTMTAQNMTEKVALSLQDNGSELLHVDSTAKTDKTKHTASVDATVKAGGTTESFQVYRQDGQQIVKSGASDVYMVFGNGKSRSEKAPKEHNDKNDQVIRNEVENVIDALVGNLKNYVTLTPGADGTKTISVQLNGNQIPTAANAIASLFVKTAATGEHQGKAPQAPFGSELQQLRNNLPKLTQDIQIGEVDLNASVDAQNHITNQKINVTVTGKDDTGAAHQVVISADIGLSDFNATTPDHVDLTGKHVQTVDKKYGHHWKD